MRVAQLIENLDAGGAEALTVDIANALAARGHSSHLIVIHGGGPLHSRVSPAVTCLDLERPRTSGTTPVRLAYRLGTCRRLVRALESHHVDVVQSHLPQANFLALWVGRQHVARVHPTIHNNLEFDDLDSRRWKRFARRRAYRLMLDWCDRSIAVSEQVRRGMARELGIDEALMARRIVTIPNGVRIGSTIDPREREALRERWGVAPDELLIAGAGRLVRQKNFEALVDALAALVDEPVPWSCVIAGEGAAMPSLEQRILGHGLASRVRLAGRLDNVQDLLMAADMFCLPSRFEGLPLVLLEALAAGLPVCATRIDGVADIVADDREAVLVAPDDVAALAEGLRQLLADPALRSRIGAAGRELAASRYGFERMMDSLEELYRSPVAPDHGTLP